MISCLEEFDLRCSEPDHLFWQGSGSLPCKSDVVIKVSLLARVGKFVSSSTVIVRKIITNSLIHFGLSYTVVVKLFCSL